MFASNQLQRCFENSDEAGRAWGQDVARKYIQRLQTLQGAATLADLRAFQALRLHALKGRRAGQHAITLKGRWRLILTYLPDEQALRVEEVSNHYDD